MNSPLDPRQRRHWIFDMDGTLTHAVHDFDALRRRLGLPSNVPVLEAIDARPAAEAARLHREVEAWEWEMVAQARAADDAVRLVSALAARGCRLGVLTRNTRRIALHTLEVTGLDRFFDSADVLGRDDAPPKPAPEGVLRLLAAWGAASDDAVMVGDYVFDLQAGRCAGALTVLVRRVAGALPDWAVHADVVVPQLGELI